MKIRKNIFIYGLFVVSIIYGLYFHLIENKGKAHDIRSVQANESVEMPEPEASVAAPVLAAIPPGWGRELFTAEINVPDPSSSAESEFNGQPRLTAISFYRSGDSFAIINNKVVQKGESVDGWKVQAIERQFVTVKNKFGVNKLNLGEKL